MMMLGQRDCDLEIKFKQPIKIKDGVEIKEFDTRMKSPTYLLVVEKRSYQINLSVYNLIKIVSKYDSLDEIANEYSKIENIEYSVNDIIIAINELLVKRDVVESIEPIYLRPIKNYLYFKFTIFPTKVLKPISKSLSSFFHSLFFKYFSLVIIIANIFLFFFCTSLRGTVSSINSHDNFALFFLLVILSNIIHEFGHISACKYYGATHSEIGAGVYLYIPAFYSNLTDIWRLKNWQRAIVDFGGIYFQLIFNLLIFIFYLITHNNILLYTFITICIQTLFTLNPFLRYDGYWALSDLLGVPNLRKRTYEILEYFFVRVILRKDNVEKPKTFDLQKKYLYFFIIYSILSNLFLVYFIGLTMFYVISKNFFIYDFILLFKNYSALIELSNLKENIGTIIKLLIKFITLLLTLFFFTRFIITFIRLIKKGFKLIYS